MADVVLGGVVEIEGEAAVTLKFAKVHRGAMKAKDGFNSADKASSKFGRALKALARVAKRVIRPLAKVFRIAKSFATLSFAGIAAGGIATGVLGIRDMGKFSLDIARIGTLLPASTDAMQKFGGAVRGAAMEFGTDTTKSAEAFFDALSAGIPTDQLKEFNQIVGEASVGGFTSQGVAIKGLTSIMDSYGLGVDRAREVSDAFFVANEKGKTTFEKLASSVGRAAPMAKAVGLNFKEFMSAVTTGTKTLETSEAVSGLKALFSNITKPTKEALDAVSQLYDTDRPEKFFSVAAVKQKGFLGFLKELKNKAGGDVETLNQLFGSVESLGIVLGLTSETGVKTFTDSLEKMESQGGQTKESFDRVADTIGFKMKQIGSGLRDARLSVGEGLVEGFGLNEIKDIPTFFQEQSKGIAEGSKAFATSLMEQLDPAFKIGKIDFKSIGSGLGTLVGTIAKGIGKLVSGIGDLVAMVGSLSEILEIANQLAGGDSPLERQAKKTRAAGGTFLSQDKTRANFEDTIGTLNAKRLGAAIRRRDLASDTHRSVRSFPGQTAASTEVLNPFSGGIGGGKAAFESTLSTRQVGLLNRFDAVMKQAEQKAMRVMRSTVVQQTKVANKQHQIRKFQEEQSRLAAGIGADLLAAKKQAGTLWSDLKKKFSLVFNLTQKQTLNVNGKKKKSKSRGASHRFERGKGDATLPTTFENQFLIFDDDGSILDVPDEFIVIPDAPESGDARGSEETLAPGRRGG